MSIPSFTTGDDGFPKPKRRYCGCRTLFLAIILPHRILGLCIERHGVSTLVQSVSRWFECLVDNGNANSSNSSFKVTIVDVAQFCDLLKLAFTAGNCRPYVCFISLVLLVTEGNQKQHACEACLMLWWWSCAVQTVNWQCFYLLIIFHLFQEEDWSFRTPEQNDTQIKLKSRNIILYTYGSLAATTCYYWIDLVMSLVDT